MFADSKPKQEKKEEEVVNKPLAKMKKARTMFFGKMRSPPGMREDSPCNSDKRLTEPSNSCFGTDFY